MTKTEPIKPEPIKPNLCSFVGEGYANVFSTVKIPSKSNVNQFMVIDNIDTSDWKLNGTHVHCRNPGVWNIILQYQMVNVSTVADSIKNCYLSGFVNINGSNVPYSSATGYVARVGSKNVLTIAFTHKFKCNDYFKVGIRSDNNDLDPNKLNVVCQSYVGITDILDPSIIITMTKTK